MTINGIMDAISDNKSVERDIFAEMNPYIKTIGIGVIVFIAIYIFFKLIIKLQDANSSVQKRNAEIVELRTAEGKVEWYVVAFENGESKLMRNLSSGKLIIAAGDYGEVTYKGKTILEFKKKGNTGKGIVTAHRNSNKLIALILAIAMGLLYIYFADKNKY